MKFLFNISIKLRLAIAFLIILILASVSTGFALYDAKKTIEEAHNLMDGPLAKERLASDWYVFIYSAVVRTSLIARSADTTLTKVFAEEIANSVKSGTSIVGKIEPLLNTTEEKKLFDDCINARKEYQSAKEKVMANGLTPEQKIDLFEKNFQPKAADYQSKVQKFLSLERSQIDDIYKKIDDESKRAFQFTLLFAIFVIAFGAASAFVIQSSITKPLQNARKSLDVIASGDLTQNLIVQGKDEISMFINSLSQMQNELASVIGSVMSSSNNIKVASSEIATGNMDLSNRTENQAGFLQKTASTMEELTSTVAVTAENSTQANKLANSAAETANKGGIVVGQVIEKMDSINAASKKIADIIGVIDGIAFQTNILALNAAVEAARAGEGGRGFAVVAAEVRNLAQRSASAAKEIKDLIQDSVIKVTDGSKLATQAGETMAEIVQSVENTSSIMNEIAAATQEQRIGIGQINQAITEMDSVTQQNAALVEEAAAAAKSMEDQAILLSDIVNKFKLG